MKRALILTLLLTIFTTSYSCGQQKDKEYLLNKDSFEKVIEQKNTQLVDVRTPKEFKEGTIDNAENVDFLSEDFLDNMQKYNKEEPIYIFCKSGKRSAKARQALLDNGFKAVYELDGGYTIW
ncbi:rhodanese-like domain-containing protein [Myroides pelagicus]|uniref:Rhodanese-like domain-containing protein n=1 Tax=Myroides pelagicus TaxID=270914 RepID=A0A7K1GH62_9FLAO|nr:rhodanese-like domain-containing protein [Myroides pelagicus]MEC4114596.1 rhodanese-like domain-containing protein [Myroides pelagicus]MTH28371.1 rhodanese-like domain-containing protein [Myroides pelagicus]